MKRSLDAVPLWIQVGARGFEPPTSSTPLKRATELRYAPTQEKVYHAEGELTNVVGRGKGRGGQGNCRERGRAVRCRDGSRRNQGRR